MPDLFLPKTEQEVSDFIFDNYNKSNPIEIVGNGSKKIGRISNRFIYALFSSNYIFNVFN